MEPAIHGRFYNCMHDLKPTIAMVVVQTAYAGVNVFYKLAVADGMSLRVIIAYRFMFSAVAIIPVALIVERGKRPPMTWTILFQTFLIGLFGASLAQNLYLGSLALTSATFISAMTNLIPAITFIMAVIFKLEKLQLRKASGKAKVVGTLMGIGGAILFTFYKGFSIDFFKTNIDLLALIGHHNISPSHPTKATNTLLGAALGLATCFSYAIWFIIQAKMNYPCEYTIAALMSIMASIQTTVYALCVERDWSQWKLGWNIRLWTVVYTGMVGSAVTLTLISWCMRMKGPLFVSVFNPLMMIMAAVSGALFLEEKLYLGSILGAILIVCGLYVVLWGKGQEAKNQKTEVPVGTL